MNAAGFHSRSWAGFTRRTLPNDRHIIASSFINAMINSRCVFSTIFAASAVRMLADWYTRPSVTFPYTAVSKSVTEGDSLATTFTNRSSVCMSSPGLMRSGEYPR